MRGKIVCRAESLNEHLSPLPMMDTALLIAPVCVLRHGPNPMSSHTLQPVPEPCTLPFKSQFGEDRLLADFFKGKTSGFYVEVGAYNGVDLSNTYYFEQIGWTGILVEADPLMAESCRETRTNSVVVQCAAVPPASPPYVPFQVSEDNRYISSLSMAAGDLRRVEAWTGHVNVRAVDIPARTLDSIFEEHNVGEIDFLTIDVEGHEWGVLQGLTLARWRPGIVILERNGAKPDFRILLRLYRNGYFYRRTTGVNDWFFREGRGLAGRAAYWSSLFKRFYLPLYKHAVKVVLIRLGLARVIQALDRRRGSRPRPV
jgi:FkbM family methyltransferase